MPKNPQWAEAFQVDHVPVLRTFVVFPGPWVCHTNLLTPTMRWRAAS